MNITNDPTLNPENLRRFLRPAVNKPANPPKVPTTGELLEIHINTVGKLIEGTLTLHQPAPKFLSRALVDALT